MFENKKLLDDLKDIKKDTFSLLYEIDTIEKELKEIKSITTQLLKMWLPTEETKIKEIKSLTKNEKGTTLIDFANKHQFEINNVKRDFKILRLNNTIAPELYTMGNNGKRKRFLISEEAEMKLLEYMNNKNQTIQPRPKKKPLTSMSKEELIKEIYKKNQQIKRK